MHDFKVLDSAFNVPNTFFVYDALWLPLEGVKQHYLLSLLKKGFRTLWDSSLLEQVKLLLTMTSRRNKVLSKTDF